MTTTDQSNPSPLVETLSLLTIISPALLCPTGTMLEELLVVQMRERTPVPSTASPTTPEDVSDLEDSLNTRDSLTTIEVKNLTTTAMMTHTITLILITMILT